MGAPALQQLLLDEGVVDAVTLASAAARADREQLSLVEVLIDEGALEEDELAELAASAMSTVVVDLEQGEVDEECAELVGREIARRHLLLPVAADPSGKSLRVAFANPLDPEAVEVVQQLTGLGVQPLVATVSGIKDAIARAFDEDEGTQLDASRTFVVGSRPTRVVAAPGAPSETKIASELPAEVTRRVDESALRGDGTNPLHRLEAAATMEQRHEALLLALIDRGVLSRADYEAALRRLLGRG